MIGPRLELLLGVIAICLLPLASHPVFAHGSVTPDGDLCIIQIGYFKAHFKIYLPQTRGLQDYCEDLPDTGDSVFVMEYEHAGLGEAPIDFRIIKNMTTQGRFAQWNDVAQIDDLDAITVFHHPAAVQPDVFTVAHKFEEAGEFIGVLTAMDPETGKTYTAVFPFEVGYFGLGYWPWIALAALLLHLNYLWMGGWSGRRRKRTELAMALAIVLAVGVVSASDIAADEPVAWKSREGKFSADYTSSLQPLVVNRMHSWVLHISDADGQPVSGAEISLSGGMPIHDHGLPTVPRMTREIDNGAYLIEGIRFHMNGDWEIEITITANGLSDVVIVPVTL